MQNFQCTIFDCHEKCVQAFEGCIAALCNPTRDFSEDISTAYISEEFGRFKVWRGNVGARHDPARKISLDFRLRDAAVYRDKIVNHLLDLSEALQKGALIPCSTSTLAAY
jgi:hypothetical protein